MNDSECVRFLQWALPRLRMRWRGFRKVRRQVCKRIPQRLHELQLSDVAAYQHYLQEHPDEWLVLDEFCRISISRFYRDRSVFDAIRDHYLPELASKAAARGASEVRCWSAGSASGEEPYTLVLIWLMSIRERFPHIHLKVVATDADDVLLERGRRGSYPASSLKELPREWVSAMFEHENGDYRLRPEIRQAAEFVRQDVRRECPDGPFDLILCRNLVFTYFDEDQQAEVLRQMLPRLVTGGLLITARKEVLPPTDHWPLVERDAALRIYEKI